MFTKRILGSLVTLRPLGSTFTSPINVTASSASDASNTPTGRRRNVICLCGAPLVLLGCVLVVLLDPLRASSQYVSLGYLFGTTFGHASMAAAWTAFGPLRLVWRLLLSLLWLVSLAFAFNCNVPLQSGPDEIPGTIAACLAGQFLVLQIPFWGLAIGYGLRLRHCENAVASAHRRELQFGIRELLIITAVVAAIFGAGRLAIAVAPSLAPQMGRETPIFIFLAAAAVMTSIPLVLAALLPRLALAAVILAMIFMSLATVSEVPLLSNFHTGPGPDIFHIIAINAFTAAWILSLAVIVRISGYRLTRG